MAPLYNGHDYYKRIFELQEKLRKSEEERIRLEERFNMLVRDSHNRHDACTNRLRMRYIQYLEEQRTRDERNHKLLAALDKVTNKLALISAKRDRLNILRKQYEAYLLRVYANRRQPGSVTGDSGIASQNEEKYTRKLVVTQPDITSTGTRSISPSRVHLSAQPSQPRSTSILKLHNQIALNGTSLNNPPILPTTPLGASLGADHHQTRVLSESHIYVSPIGQSSEQLARVSKISSPNTLQYPQIISGYDRSPSRSLRDIRASCAKGPILPITSLSEIPSDTVPANRFFRESVQAGISGLPTQFSAGDIAARYEETSRKEPIPRQFDPSTVFRYQNASTMLSNPQSLMKEYDPSAIAGPTLTTAKSNTYRVEPDASIVDEVGPLPGYRDYIVASPQKSEDEGSIRSFTSDDVDDLIRRNEHVLWRSGDGVKIPCRSQIDVLGLYNANPDENGKTTAILENELDQYISKIRKLHREHGISSVEELDHEQNTSGDLLNVTLSEDAAELPVEDRARKERVPEGMDRILALASDLAFRTTGSREVARDAIGQSDNDMLSAEVVGDEIRRREATTDDTLQFEGKREAEEREISAKNKIREDVATHSTELEQNTRRNTDITKESWNNPDNLAEPREHDREEFVVKKDDTREKIAESSNDGSQIDDRKNVSEKKHFDLVTAEESNIEDVFDVAEELPPWDLASMQKEVRELYLDSSVESDEDRTIEKHAEDTEDRIDDKIANESHILSPFMEQSGANDEAEKILPQDTLPRAEMEPGKVDAREASENAEDTTSQSSNQRKADVSKLASRINEELGESRENNDEKREDDETTKPRIENQSGNMTQNNEYDVEREYVEDSSHERQYEQDSNEQYRYDQNLTYEGANKEEYEGYAQGYVQEGQEYAEYADGQYGQYPEDPNNPQYQHDPNAQYQQDPNQAYDYNYDPNQGYVVDPNQPYDPNQEYGNDPNQRYDLDQGYGNGSGNQAYDYTEQVSYDPNQVYDGTYEEYKDEQHSLNNNIVGENREEQSKIEETAQGHADPESEHKSSRAENEPSRVDDVNGTKKKKDAIKSLLDSDTDTTIERNVSNTESDFDFN